MWWITGICKLWKCNKIDIHALLNLAHESGGIVGRHCSLVIGYWGPVGCEVNIIISLGWGVLVSGRFLRGGGARTCLNHLMRPNFSYNAVHGCNSITKPVSCLTSIRWIETDANLARDCSLLRIRVIRFQERAQLFLRNYGSIVFNLAFLWGFLVLDCVTFRSEIRSLW